MGILAEHDTKTSLSEANGSGVAKTSEPAKAIHKFQATTAIAVSWIVVTANCKHFSQIPGVQLDDWSR